MERTIISVMEKEATKFQSPKKVMGLVRGGSQLICGRDLPDLSNRPEELPMFEAFFGGKLTEINNNYFR